MNTFEKKRNSARCSRWGMALMFSALVCTPSASVAMEAPNMGETAPSTILAEPNTTETVYYFVALMNDGTKLSIPFAERPVLTTQGVDLLLTTTKMEMELPQGSVKEFTLEKKDETTAVEEVLQKGEFQRQGDSFFFTQCKEGSWVRVFDRSGRVVAAQQVDANGQCQVSLQGQPSGIYIVKSESITCKILKK